MATRHLCCAARLRPDEPAIWIDLARVHTCFHVPLEFSRRGSIRDIIDCFLSFMSANLQGALYTRLQQHALGLRCSNAVLNFRCLGKRTAFRVLSKLTFAMCVDCNASVRPALPFTGTNSQTKCPPSQIQQSHCAPMFGKVTSCTACMPTWRVRCVRYDPHI